MIKVRIVYGTTVAITAVLFFWSAKLYLFATLTVMLVLPLLLRFLLRIECRNLKIMPEIKNACQVGQNITIAIQVQGRGKFFFAAGLVNLVLDLENKMLGQKREVPITIGLSRQTVAKYLPYIPQGCGQITVRVKNVCCYDIMGLNCLQVPVPDTLVLTVYPEKLPLGVIADSFLSGFREGEQQTVSRRGNDQTEVFDLREYQTGDDVRAIHWKLSEKMDKLLVKEPSDTSHYSTMILLDAGRFQGKEQLPMRLLSAAVGLALTFSEKLLDLGILHYTGIPSGDGIFFHQVTEQAEHMRVVDTWMDLTLEKQGGQGLRYFLADRINRGCRHMIYITAGAFPDNIYMLPADLHITAVCVQDRGGEVRATRKGLGVFMEIPLGRLNESVHNIVI